MSVTVENMVGTGNLGVEINLEGLVEDIDVAETKYDPSFYPGAYVRFTEGAPLITVYRTGKYIISGAKTSEDLNGVRDQLLDRLVAMGVISEGSDTSFYISNVVATADLERELDLNALAIGLGLENAEYEPEQFPGLIYHPEGVESVLLLFRSGKVVVTGANSVEAAEESFVVVNEQLQSMFNEAA